MLFPLLLFRQAAALMLGLLGVGSCKICGLLMREVLTLQSAGLGHWAGPGFLPPSAAIREHHHIQVSDRWERGGEGGREEQPTHSPGGVGSLRSKAPWLRPTWQAGWASSAWLISPHPSTHSPTAPALHQSTHTTTHLWSPLTISIYTENRYNFYWCIVGLFFADCSLIRSKKL